MIRFNDNGFTYTATVLGTQPYNVIVSNKSMTWAGAIATWAKTILFVNTWCSGDLCRKRGGKLSQNDKIQIIKPTSSGVLRELSEAELKPSNKKLLQPLNMSNIIPGRRGRGLPTKIL